jgi:DNA-binding protein HU-beta
VVFSPDGKSVAQSRLDIARETDQRAGPPRRRRLKLSQQQSKEQPLNTTELADAVAEAHDLPKAKAKEIVSSIFALIIDTAKKGDEIAIGGFGKFSVKERPAREGRNPRTGETLKIAASSRWDSKCPSPAGRRSNGKGR